jgi:3-methyl-2-oxobutanoate hydroxymethyltransferase
LAQANRQVLIVHDMLRLNQEFLRKFVRKYAELGDTVKKAVNDYILDFKNSDFPSVSESFENPTKEVV